MWKLKSKENVTCVLRSEQTFYIMYKKHQKYDVQ